MPTYDIEDYKMAQDRAKSYAINGIGPNEAALRERIVKRLEALFATEKTSARKYSKDVLGFSHTVVSTFMNAPWTESKNVFEAMAERDPLNFSDIHGMISLERSRDQSPGLHVDQSGRPIEGLVLRPAEVSVLLDMTSAMRKAIESIESKLRKASQRP